MELVVDADQAGQSSTGSGDVVHGEIKFSDVLAFLTLDIQGVDVILGLGNDLIKIE